MRVDLESLLEPETTVVLTQECQRGVVGADSALPELAAAARESGMLTAVGRLVRGARAADVTVLHAVAARRADGKGASRNARLFRAAERLPVRQLLGSSAVEIAEEIGAEPSDLFSTRLHGLSPLAGTDADALLRNLGCRTLVIVGVSANVAGPSASPADASAWRACSSAKRADAPARSTDSPADDASESTGSSFQLL